MKTLVAAVLVGALAGAAITYAVLDRSSPPKPAETPVRDLDSVPKMTQVAAQKHRQDRYENIYSIEQILALPSDFAETEALYVLAGRSDSGAVQNLIYEANRIADDQDRSGALSILFSRLTELDPQSALALARSTSFAAEKSMEANVWRSWARNDLDAALAAALAQPSLGQRNVAAQAMYSGFGYMGNETTDRIESELGIRPDRTSRARFIYAMADRSPEETIQYIEQLESTSAQRESTSWLAYHLARSDADRAASFTMLFTDQRLQEQYKSIVASSNAATDPISTLQNLLGSQMERSDYRRAYTAMRELVTQDVDSALNFFSQTQNAQQKQLFAQAIAEELTRQDPLRALEWARETGLRDVETTVLSNIATRDPQFAMQEAMKIQNIDRRRDVVSSIAQMVARTDGPLAMEMISQLPTTGERNYSSVSVFRRWLESDSNAALAWIESQSSADTAEMLGDTGRYLAMTNIDAAMRILPRISGQAQSGWRNQIAETLAERHSTEQALAFVERYRNTDGYESVMAAAVGGLVKNDIATARRLVDQMPAGGARDSALAKVVAEHANSNPAEAASWITSIADAQQRNHATTRVSASWYAQDPQAATRWVSNLPRGSMRDDAIVGLAGQWRDPSPAQQSMIDSIEDDSKRTRARTSQIYRIARHDWQRAQNLLDSVDLTSEERQRVQSFIDRYRGQ